MLPKVAFFAAFGKFVVSFMTENERTPSGPNVSVWCVNNAPLFAYQKRGSVYAVTQGCCNSWTCPRCGVLRAKKEYGRIVHGSRMLEETHTLYMMTITTRGAGLKVKDAHDNYLEWTNRLLSALRYNAKKRDVPWCYTSVTEHQKRGHPHSHFMMTWYPGDMRDGTRRKRFTDNDGNLRYENVPRVLSDYLQKRCISAGLGEIYDIGKVDTVEGASRYVAKYLFKPEMFTDDFPKNWHRVRYSQSFPKLPERETNAFVLLETHQWEKLAKLAAFIDTDCDQSYNYTYARLTGRGPIISPPVQKTSEF